LRLLKVHFLHFLLQCVKIFVISSFCEVCRTLSLCYSDIFCLGDGASQI